MVKHDHSMEEEHEDYEDSDSSSGPLARAADGGAEARPPPKKRNRAALSCTLCRERKVKCDRVIPCQQCIKRGDADYCHLDPAKRGPQSNPKVTGQSRRDTSKSQSNREHNHSHGHSIPPPPEVGGTNEVDTIKARLAQLEQALAQQQQGESPSFSIPSTSSGFSPNITTQNGLTRPSWATMHNDSSSSNSLPVFSGVPANQFAPSRSSSTSMPRQSPLPSYFSQQGIDESLAGRTSTMGSSQSPPSVSNFNVSSNRSKLPDSSNMPYTNMVASSFTLPSDLGAETDKSSTRTGSASHRAEVDSDTEDAALVLEGLAMGARNECEKTAKRDVILQPLSSKSIEAYAEDDKTKDIMSVDRYKKAGPNKGRGALPLTGPQNDSCGKEDEEECAVLAEMLASDPDAEFGPDGKRIPPAKRVCILLSRHENSLFNLVYGPETFLGWGMGWAFAAAEAAGDMMKVSDVVGCKGALQREAVLRAIIRSLPDRESAVQLIDVYESRVKYLTGNCVHIPTFRREMAAFYDLETVEKRARVVNFVDPGWLSLFLMMLVHSLHFHPIERPESIMHFFDGRTIHLWRSAAQTSLVLARYQSSSSIAVLQALILVNFYAYCTGKNDNALRHVAISNAIEMGLHRLGSKDQQPKADESASVTIRREIAKRIWYNLVICDWCSCTGITSVYRIHPTHFNTPLPGNYNDADLCILPLPAPHPITEHTEMSFMLQQIQVTTVMREHVDMQNATKLDSGRLNCSDTGFLDGRYRGLLEQAPSFYRIGSEEGENENIEVERWLFQQFIFDKLLRLHRPNLSSKMGARTSCVLLARSILDVQRRIRSRCSVVDRLFMKLSQSFSAAIVLCLDLLQNPPSSSSSMRDIVRGEVFEALQALRHVGASHHATTNHVRVIEALLEEEQARWTQNETKMDEVMGRPTGPLRKKNLLNLALRVAKATQGEEPFKPSVGSNSDTTMMDTQMSDENQSSEQSRRLMEQLLMGKPSYDEPSSFSRADFQKATLFDANQLDLSQVFPTDDNSHPFDLGKFLAECDTNSSPGSVGSGQAPYEAGFNSGASDSGHSSLHNGRTNSTTSLSRMSHSSSQSRLGNTSANHSPIGAFKAVDDISLLGYVPTQGLSPTAAEKSTGLDGFWNWILAQGSIPSGNVEKSQPQPPLGQGSALNFPSVQSQSQSQPPYLDNSLPRKSSEAEDAAAIAPINNTNNTNSEAVFSLGTPSAGIGSSWMNTPGLFDFALEAGNDGSSLNNLNNNGINNNGFGSIIAPNTATYWS